MRTLAQKLVWAASHPPTCHAEGVGFEGVAVLTVKPAHGEVLHGRMTKILLHQAAWVGVWGAQGVILLTVSLDEKA